MTNPDPEDTTTNDGGALVDETQPPQNDDGTLQTDPLTGGPRNTPASGEAVDVAEDLRGNGGTQAAVGSDGTVFPVADSDAATDDSKDPNRK